jgi:hypothetical protein
VERALRTAVYDPETLDLPVMPAGLGPDSAAIGAALAAAAARPG